MTTIEATPALARPRIDISLAFKGGWKAFTADIVPLLVGSVIACLLSIVTVGILAGPLFAGLYQMVSGRIRDGRRAQVGDVFSCMSRCPESELLRPFKNTFKFFRRVTALAGV